ncbi:MAG TPA: ABC transporter ATP-binding protein [Alphaproteobacteria bacterium]
MDQPSQPAFAVRARGVRKVYRGRTPVVALKGLDLDLPRGSIFGLLGPNGAGKSTFINILAGLVLKTEGTVEIWGHDIDRERRAASAAIGIVPQELVIDPFFTPRETLEIQAGYYGVPRAERRTEAILAVLGLTDHAEAYVRRLSGGMRRRLMVAKAMVHDPPVLVLDEPTAGVDVELRAQLWDHVRELNAAGTTVLLTTHYLEEAEEMCDRIAIINHGEVVACDRTEALVHRLDRKELILVMAEDLEAVPAALGRFGAELAGPRRLVLHYRPSETRIAEVLDAVERSDLEVADLTTREPDLEDLFLSLTRRARP